MLNANFSPTEQLIAAAIIVLTLLAPWWVGAAVAVGLAGGAGLSIYNARRKGSAQ